MKVERVRIFNQTFLPLSAEQAWAYLIDWAGTNRKRTGNMGELTLAKIELIGGITDIPRTRVMEFGAFGLVRETLLHQDDDAMHIYYNIEGIGPYGVRNYLATTDIDPIDAGHCQITITARFDLDEQHDVVKAKGIIDLAHHQAVIAAMRRYYDSLHKNT